MSTFMQEDKIERKIGFIEAARRLWPYTRTHLRLLIITLLSVLGLATLQRLTPYFLGQAVEVGIQKRNYPELLNIALYLLYVEILVTLFTFSHQYLFSFLGNKVLQSLRKDLMQHLLSLPLNYFNRNPAGRIVNRLTTDVAALGDFFTDGVITVFTQIMVLVSLVVAMALISFKLTLLCLFLTPFFLWISIYISKRVNKEHGQSKKLLSSLSSYLTESIAGMKILHLYNYRHQRVKTFTEINRNFKGQSRKLILTSAWMQPVLNLFSGILLSSALFFASRSLQLGEISIGALVTFLLHTQDFLPPIRDILEKYQQFQNSLTSADRIFGFLGESAEKDWSLEKPPLAIAGEIKISNLSFRYTPDDPWVLKDINLQIPRGQSLALIGRTGSGKTTLTALLQRFYQSPVNTIFIDQQPIESLPLLSLREQIGIIQQDPFLFRGSLRQNLNLTDTLLSDDAMIAALNSVGLTDPRLSSRSGLETSIEERGANLSLGERQMISFARILLKDPKILILDEATANIDSIAEEKIQIATQKILKGRTAIIIAHRLSTIEACDCIALLDQGQVVEFGTHSELMARDSQYRKWREQKHNDADNETKN